MSPSSYLLTFFVIVINMIRLQMENHHEEAEQ
jgi:hypothetical protein